MVAKDRIRKVSIRGQLPVASGSMLFYKQECYVQVILQKRLLHAQTVFQKRYSYNKSSNIFQSKANSRALEKKMAEKKKNKREQPLCHLRSCL